jgi:carbonic anhydrase
MDIALLKDKNNKYLSQTRVIDSEEEKKTRAALAKKQSPHTIVLACSDSRVDVEKIFSADLGELFVIKIAGNILTKEILASIEFAALSLGSKNCLVLGHTCCGAVSSAIAYKFDNAPMPSENIKDLVENISKTLPPKEPGMSDDEYQHLATVANIKNSISEIKDRSEGINNLVEQKNFFISAAIYDISSGVVSFVN